MSDNGAITICWTIAALLCMAVTFGIWDCNNRKIAGEEATKQLRILLGKPEPVRSAEAP